jgi:hypothetical protein
MQASPSHTRSRQTPLTAVTTLVLASFGFNEATTFPVAAHAESCRGMPVNQWLSTRHHMHSQKGNSSIKTHEVSPKSTE